MKIKKIYQKPDTKTVILEHQPLLKEASPGDPSGPSNAPEYRGDWDF